MKDQDTQQKSEPRNPSSMPRSPELRSETVIATDCPCTVDADRSTTCSKTPYRATPNSSRKLLHTPNLLRKVASPSHSAKVSILFEEAASTMQCAMTPSRWSASNIKSPRMPSSQTRFTRFGNAHCGSITLAPRHAHEDGHIDSGLAFKQIKPGYETFDRTPTRDRPTTPLRAQMPLNDCALYHPLPDPLSPPFATDRAGFATVVHASHVPLDDPQAREPISSGFTTPANSSIPFRKTSAGLLHPARGSRNLPQSSPPANQSDSDDEEHSTHGVRLILPYTQAQAEEAQQANIEAWLEQVLGADSKKINPVRLSCEDESDAKGMQDTVFLGESPLEGFSTDSDSESTHGDRPPSRHSSNKENVPPPLPPRIPPPPYISSSSTPLGTGSHTYQRLAFPRPTDSVKKFSHPLTHAGYLSAPPRRKKLRVNEDVSTPSKSERTMSQDYTIRDDDLATALATLSPSVEQHRKGRGPRRERCASFWDKDIIGPGKPTYPNRKPSKATEDHAELPRNDKQL